VQELNLSALLKPWGFRISTEINYPRRKKRDCSSAKERSETSAQRLQLSELHGSSALVKLNNISYLEGEVDGCATSTITSGWYFTSTTKVQRPSTYHSSSLHLLIDA